MKNLLRSTLYLSVFALAGVLFQISCSNSDNQDLTPNSTPIGKLIYYKYLYGTPGGSKIYTCDYDGTNETLVNAILPSGAIIDTNTPDELQLRISPDGEKIFFVGLNISGNKTLYSCDITGGNAIEVIDLNGTGQFTLGGAY